MDKPEVLVVWPNRPEQMQILEQTYSLHRLDQAEDPEALLQQVAPRIRAVVTSHGGGLKQSLVERLPKLEIVASSGVGVDTLCVDFCHSRGIPVTHTPGVLTEDVADMGMLLLLATVRRLVQGERWVRGGHWQSKGMMPLNTSIRGKKLGIVGFGRIGKAVALRAETFGLEVSYYGRRQQQDIAYPYYDSLPALARDVDILLLALPGGDETQGILDGAVLEALGPRGYLINVARGSVVDEPALVAALQQGTIAGAGLDVFADEPRVPPALLDMENVVLQPHCSSGTVETRGAMAQLVVDNLAAHFAGRALLTPVS
ncbi:dihydrofolate reductase [Marinobacterium aestuarii]|uniref:Dihydrofolate reductase n=1 Tax=Marinobacterium aestuarii TaxID=1821621 RepID=A0A1A9F636_9GAMM|nr:2-hydroxyacid dehydrogenase [Marinobacterium aestuarii]ANG65358.1 dihydrofolate reductase [Marinobacterium aestuarii]